MNISLQGIIEFTHNHGTPLEIIGIELSICGDIHVIDNVGIHGGGFRLLGTSSIVVLLYWHGNSCNSLLNFTGNSDLSIDGAAACDIYWTSR